MTSRFVKTALAVAAVVPLAVVATPGSALAVDDGYVWACWAVPGDSINGGCVKFHQHGEILVVRDNKADGWGTRGQIQKLLPDSSGVLHWENHSSNCFDDTSHGNTGNGGTSCDYSINEGVKVRVHVWASRNGVTRYHNYSPSIGA